MTMKELAEKAGVKIKHIEYLLAKKKIKRDMYTLQDAFLTKRYDFNDKAVEFVLQNKKERK